MNRLGPVGISTRTLLIPFVLASSILCGSTFAQTDPSTTPATVNRGTDILSQWQQHQHLYTRGDANVSDTQLAALEAWLDANAKNWTVLIAETGSGESFTDVSSVTRYDVDAIEYAFGQGLPNQTGYGQLKHPESGDANGASFAIFIKDRKFVYSASDAYDRRRLGEANFKGNLDGPAINAMRGGGRIIDAVKDFIADVDKKLATQITYERESREKAARDAKTTLAIAGESLRLLEKKSTALRENSPTLYGDLVEPGVPQLRSELGGAEALVAADPAKALATAKRVRERCEQIISAIDRYPHDAARFTDLEDRVNRQANTSLARPTPPQIQSARDAIKAARAEYDKGDSMYVVRLQSADTAVGAAEQAVASALRTKKMARNAAAGGVGGLVAIVAAIAWGFNRRRLPTKLEALRLLQTWKDGLGAKNGALVELLDRRLTVVGSSSEEIKQQFAGETLELAQQVVKDVDALFIMTACADRVLQEADKLCEPSLSNSFTTGNYRAAILRLSAEPISFKPEEALEFAVKGTRQTHSGLTGGAQTQKAFAMSFTDLMRDFEERARRAQTALNEIESALVNTETTLNSSRKIIAAIAAKEASLSDTTITPCFAVPDLFSRVLPAIGDQLDQASELGVRDPVAAARHQLPDAGRKTNEASQVLELCSSAREQTLAKLQEATRLLQSTGLAANWPEEQYVRISNQLDDLVPVILDRSIKLELDALSARLGELTERIHEALELEKTRRELALPAIQKLNHAIDATRSDIASRLSLRAEHVLHELDADPSERTRRAAAEVDSARLALDRGDTTGARNALDAANALTGEAGAMLEATRKAFEAHDSLQSKFRSETARIRTLVSDHERALRVIRENYSPSVLVLGSGDPAHPNANGTLEDNPQEAKAKLAQADAFCEDASQVYRGGEILKASELLSRVSAVHEFAAYRLREIKDKEKRLADTVASNGRIISELEIEQKELAASADDSRTSMATVQAFTQAREQFATARILMKAHPNDPFQTAALLSRVRAEFEQITSQARNDWDMFAEAERSLRSAQEQLNQAHRVSKSAAADEILDSVAIMRARSELALLDTRLSAAQQTLKQAHSDWATLDHEADTITSEASRHAATMRGEIDAAQAASRQISDAAQFVRSASGWRGRFRIRIDGSPGSAYLEHAREALSVANYQRAFSMADAARREAASAIAAAEAELRRQERLEEEREEAERRRRRREAASYNRGSSSSSRSSSSSWGSSGSSSRSSWGGGSSGGSSSSWGGSSSGSRSSGFSSGSGGAQSGW